jgi:gamma-glutamylaminecyclotransferase
MCIIIIKQKNQVISREVAKNSARINPHGLGIVWLDTFEVTYHKSRDYKVIITDRPFIANFRYATIGAITKSNTHPFVCGQNKNEMLMMNGTINGFGNDKMTDTEDLAIKIGSTARQTWKKQLANFEARFVSVNLRHRSFQIYNRHLYTYKDGIWYSKTNVLQDNVIAVYGTLKKGYGNYYGYLTNAKHIGKGKTQDQYPLVVNGLPYLLDKKGKGKNVVVDVFKVSDQQLAMVDRLESHPLWYVRQQIPVVVKGKTIMCWTYFNQEGEYYWNGHNHVESYANTPKWKPYSFIATEVEEVKTEVEEVKTEEVEAHDCTQIDLFDDDMEAEFDVRMESPICKDTECNNDLVFDGFNQFYCSGCERWYAENDIMSIS